MNLRSFAMGVAFALLVGIAGGATYAALKESGPEIPPSSAVATAGAATLTATATAPSAAAPSTDEAEERLLLPDRVDCGAIRGSDYRSATERQWFLANCIPTPTATRVPAPVIPATLAPPTPRPTPIPPPRPTATRAPPTPDVRARVRWQWGQCRDTWARGVGQEQYLTAQDFYGLDAEDDLARLLYQTTQDDFTQTRDYLQANCVGIGSLLGLHSPQHCPDFRRLARESPLFITAPFSTGFARQEIAGYLRAAGC